MPYWLGRRGSQQTSCSEWWFLLPASSVTLGSSMAVCRGYCITSSTGSTSLTEYNLSSPCWCIDVFMEWLRCTWWTAAHQWPTLLVVNICGLPVSGSWSFRAIVWTVMVVGVLLLRARRPGIAARQSSRSSTESQHFYASAEDTLFCEILTRCTERIRDFFENALYKFTLYLFTCT